MIQRNIELYSPPVRIAAFVPNKKQIVMHDMKFLTQKVITLKDVEYPFGNFSTIL